MSVTVEKLEKSMAKLTVEVPAEEFEKAINVAYNKMKGKIQMPGFRKGKAPRNMIEKMYGKEVFYEEAANECLQTAYPQAYDESGLDIVSQPEIDIVQVEAGKPFIFTATVAVKPEVKLGEYKGVEVEKREVNVTDEDVDAEIKKELEKNASIVTVEDRAVEDGDTVNIDYSGSVDGEKFEGGTSEGYDLVIGSHSFIDTFEEQIIGKNIGDEFDVNVTFPEEYHSEALAGKAAVFAVKVNGIKATVLPELDDDFAQDVSDFDTLDEYKADVKTKLEERKKKDADYLIANEAVAVAADNAEMEIPEPMIKTQADDNIQNFGRRLQQQGVSLEQYMQWTGTTVEQLKEQMLPEAEKQIRQRLTLEAVVVAENIEVADEDIDEEIRKMAPMYGMDPEELLKSVQESERKMLKMDMAVDKAKAFLAENAKQVEKAAEAKED